MNLTQYVAPARRQRQAKHAPTLVPGTVNENGQEVLHRAGRAADDLPGQHLYLLRCTHCAHEYAEAGIRVDQRKCPRCSGGKPAIDLPESEQMTLF